MANAVAPIIDQWAPAQFVTQPQIGNTEATTPMATQATNSTYDATITWKIAGTIVFALLTVFVLQRLGFRFVVSAGVGRA